MVKEKDEAKFEARRAALQDLADGLGRGGIAHIAARIGKDASYVSRMLYPPGKPGRKRIGEDTVDDLNRAFPNWMRIASSDNISPSMSAPNESDAAFLSAIQAELAYRNIPPDLRRAVLALLSTAKPRHSQDR